MSFQGEIEARCPACKEVFEAPVWSLVSGAEETLRNQVKARECNLLLCAHCGEAFIPDVSWIYFEPEADLLAFVFPEAWKPEEAKWREKMQADFAQMREALGEKMPTDMEPAVFFGQDGLGELLDKEDWRADERDVMRVYAEELGLSVYRASASWARAHGTPAEFPYKGTGKPTRDSLIAGMKALIKANDALTAWDAYLAEFTKAADAPIPPPAKKR